MKNTTKQRAPWEMSEKDKQKEIRKWFQVDEVIYFERHQQREVVLNPGQRQEIFRKTYPVKGEIVLHKTHYISDLPQNCSGRIIAVTAVQPKDRQGNPKGELKIKPISKHWELFESGNGGTRYWVNPAEYKNVNNRKTRRKDKRVYKQIRSVPTRIGDDKANQQVLRGIKGRDIKKDSTTARTKGKGGSAGKRS